MMSCARVVSIDERDVVIVGDRGSFVPTREGHYVVRFVGARDVLEFDSMVALDRRRIAVLPPRRWS